MEAFDGLNLRKVHTVQFSVPIREARPTQFQNFSMYLLHAGPRFSPGDAKMVRNGSALKILTV